MRPLEIAIPVFIALYLLWRQPRPFIIRMLPPVTLLLTLLHFAFEGYRWQMVPLYALTSMLALGNLFRIKTSGDWSRRTSLLMIPLLLIATALPILLPVPKIPAPGGEYPVGTVIHEMTDDSRKELYSGRDEARRFMIQAWYPAKLSNGNTRAPWMANASVYTPAIATYIKLPPFFLDHLALVKIPAYQGASMASSQERFPVILFSHGWNGFNAQNTGQALELASHGYVVIGIQHTYGAVVTVFPDGTVAPNNPDALPRDANDPNYEAVAQVLVDQWAGDMSFVLDQLTAWNDVPQNDFFQKLDLERVGVYGHSTGGGAAIQFCGTDPRCKAVLGMDPFMRPVSTEVIKAGVEQPSFFMFSEAWAEIRDSKNNQLFAQFRPHAIDNRGVIEILGTRHYDFSDLPLLSPIAPQLGLKGPLNGSRVTEIVDSYLLDFFELTLKGSPSSLFDGAFTNYPEIKELK
jgi:predicted dienelactone hydrolase